MVEQDIYYERQILVETVSSENLDNEDISQAKSLTSPFSGKNNHL